MAGNTNHPQAIYRNLVSIRQQQSWRGIAQIVAASQELTQNVKGALHRSPLFSRLRSPPKMMVVPVALAGQWQREWAANYRCPEAYKRIDQWCARHGHSELVACLAHLHQQMRLATVAEVGRGHSARLSKTALLPMVKSHRRHRSRKPANRGRLLRRHLGHLVAIGLARSGSRWAEFMDVSEADILDLKIQKSTGQNASASLSESLHQNVTLKIVSAHRGSNARGRWRDALGRFGTSSLKPPCRPKAGSEVRQAERPPCSKTDLPPCNPIHPEAERSDAPPPTPDDSVAGEKAVGEAESVAVAGFLARVGKLSSPEERETLAQKQAEQMAYEARMAAVRTAAAARRAAPRRESTPPRRPPPAATQPRAMVRRQQGAVIPAGATLTHGRIRARVAVLTGRSVADATADPGAIEKTPATRSELLAAVPQLAWDRTLVGKLLHRQVSALAAWHAWAAAFGGGVPPGGNYVGRMLKNAEHYQAYFRGERVGWCPYRALLRRKSTNLNGLWRARR